MKSAIGEQMNDNMKRLWAKNFFYENPLIVLLAEVHKRTIKEMHLENKKYRWFMLFKKNREKYQKTFDRLLFKDYSE